jgi:hypothetical protein
VTIFTASWFAKLPPGHVRIGISRGVPKTFEGPSYRKLAPKKAKTPESPSDFEKRYAEQLKALDCNLVVRRLEQLAAGKIPVLCCWEHAESIHDGRCWCHRHLVAAWIEHHQRVPVEEIGWPNLDRWHFLRDPQPPKKPRTIKAAPKRMIKQSPVLSQLVLPWD